MGVVTTADLTDATPAAVWGHSGDRGESALLAAQSLDLPGGPPQVLLGGGRRHFAPLLPQLTKDFGFGAAVEDAAALCAAADCAFGAAGGVSESLGVNATRAAAPDRLIGLFTNGNMATCVRPHPLASCDALP